MPELEPLPQAAITAAHLRRMAADLILQAEQLEASTRLHQYQPKEKVGSLFGKWGNEEKGKATTPTRRKSK